ncbi:TPA: DEAD/DEAH box helicase [Vibrio parahaemolyticus]|nr:AAA family ATPase [Vibrio parahaemolyticus]
MSEYCFFTPESLARVESAGLHEYLVEYSNASKKQLYVLARPLAKEDLEYDYDQAFVIFSSGSHPCFVNLSEDDDAGFEDFIEDFIDDISFLSEKFEYRKKIGRKKAWTHLFKDVSSEDLNLDELVIDNPLDKRVSDLITSLVIGSINDVSKITLETTNLLDTVKSKIVLFDTDQTSFVFKMGAGKKFVIQGLAGSGKTELLLHKIKELYSNEQDARIAFTCFNKILASNMKKRIPEFFNFMKVERQIEWDSKLFCFSSWGNGNAPYSGMYRYICHKYDIPFGTLRTGSLEFFSKEAVRLLNERIEGGDELEHIFDYVFIDESQDFGESFIELCELITKEKVFVAGDVFQNIFRPIDDSVLHANLVLKKCYRTDPKNLMFAHALGMGLYEEPVLRWLQPQEWDACGYNYVVENGKAIVSRDPLRRFEDIPDDYRSTSLHVIGRNASVSDSIVNVIKSIIEKNETVTPGDIAVLFLDKSSYIYDEIPLLGVKVSENFGWDVNISHESKTTDPSKMFISNINNAKGLEFPFVICFALNLHRGPYFRNGLYTMMARSFLESHLVVSDQTDSELLTALEAGMECMNSNGYMSLRVPPRSEIESQNALLVWNELPTMEDKVKEFCEEKGASPRLIAKLIQRMSELMKDVEDDDDYFNDMINAEYKRFVKL